MKLKLHIIILFLLSTVLFTSRSYAHFGSKGLFGGGISCSISRDSLVYIGTYTGGVYISSNTSITAWTARPVGLKSGKITALAHTGSYLFAATADSGVFIFNGFQGSDRYWNKVNTGLTQLKIRSLLAIDSITVLAGTETGLYITTNKGANWTKLNHAAFNSTMITSMAKAGNRILALTGNAGVYYTDNSGSSWNALNDSNSSNLTFGACIAYNDSTRQAIISGLHSLYVLSDADTTTTANWVPCHTGIPIPVAIFTITSDKNNWYLGTSNGVYLTALSAFNWTTQNTGLTTASPVTAIAIAQNRIIAGTLDKGIFKASAGVMVWSALNTNLNNVVTKSMATAGDSLIVALTADGIFVSKNLATSYVRSNSGLTDSINLSDVQIHKGVFYASSLTAGIYYSMDSGSQWMVNNAGLLSVSIAKLFTASHHIYAFDASGHLYESSSPSTDWTNIDAGLPSGAMPTSLCAYDGKLFLGTASHGVFTRDLHEGSWKSINNGLTDLHVTSVAASGAMIFAGTNGHGVFVSPFDSVVWSASSPTSIAHTALMGLDGMHIQAMANYAGYVYASYKGGLLATADNGLTWIAGGNQFNLPSFTDVRKIGFVSSRVFVTTENNALYSNSLSELPLLNDTLIVSKTIEYITSVQEEEIVVSVTSNRSWTVSANESWITISPVAGNKDGEFEIVASPNTTGILRMATVTVTAGAKVQTILIYQNFGVGVKENDLEQAVKLFPNPSHGVMFIESSVAFSQLSVSDLTGKEVARVQTADPVKYHELNLNLPSGLYLLQLHTDKGLLTRKISIQ